VYTHPETIAAALQELADRAGEGTAGERSDVARACSVAVARKLAALLGRICKHGTHRKDRSYFAVAAGSNNLMVTTTTYYGPRAIGPDSAARKKRVPALTIR
jgi:hypothetical protein